VWDASETKEIKTKKRYDNKKRIQCSLKTMSKGQHFELSKQGRKEGVESVINRKGEGRDREG